MRGGLPALPAALRASRAGVACLRGRRATLQAFAPSRSPPVTVPIRFVVRRPAAKCSRSCRAAFSRSASEHGAPAPQSSPPNPTDRHRASSTEPIISQTRRASLAKSCLIGRGGIFTGYSYRLLWSASVPASRLALRVRARPRVRRRRRKQLSDRERLGEPGRGGKQAVSRISEFHRSCRRRRAGAGQRARSSRPRLPGLLGRSDDHSSRPHLSTTAAIKCQGVCFDLQGG